MAQNLHKANRIKPSEILKNPLLPKYLWAIALLLSVFWIVSCSEPNNIEPNSQLRPSGQRKETITPYGVSYPHRGRIQIQGEDMNPETSWAWSKNTPVTKSEAMTELQRLYDALSTRQKQDRTQAMEKASDFIRTAPPSGHSAFLSRSFQNSPPRLPTIRIDIEIIAGSAFVD